MKFERLVELITENPDYCFGNMWDEAEFCFIYKDNFIIIGNNETTHGQLLNYLKLDEKLKSYKDKHLEKTIYDKFPWSDRPSKQRKIQIIGKSNSLYNEIDNTEDSLPRRKHLIEKGFLLGRVWNIGASWFSFWNPISYVKKEDLINLEKLLPDIKNCELEFGPETTFSSEKRNKNITIPEVSNDIDIDDCVWGTYSEILEFLDKGEQEKGKPSEEKIGTQDFDVLHLLNPENKAEAMKKRGIVPKTPIPLKDRMRRDGD